MFRVKFLYPLCTAGHNGDYMLSVRVVVSLILAVLLTGCTQIGEDSRMAENSLNITGKGQIEKAVLKVFHAGSLTEPMKAI